MATRATLKPRRLLKSSLPSRRLPSTGMSIPPLCLKLQSSTNRWITRQWDMKKRPMSMVDMPR